MNLSSDADRDQGYVRARGVSRVLARTRGVSGLWNFLMVPVRIMDIQDLRSLVEILAGVMGDPDLRNLLGELFTGYATRLPVWRPSQGAFWYWWFQGDSSGLIQY